MGKILLAVTKSNISSIRIFLYLVFPNIQWKGNFTDLVELLEGYSHEVKVKVVIWKTPPNSVYKLNTDGSALNNHGKIEGCGILRN